MATLTETAKISRTAIMVAGIGLVVLMVGRFMLTAAISFWRQANPLPPPPPTMGFGALPDITFPQKEVGELTYLLETPTGQFPAFSDRANVYLMPEKFSPFEAAKKAQAVAQGLGFKDQGTTLSEVRTEWTLQEPLSIRLLMQIYWQTFVYSADWSKYPEFLTQKQLPADPQAVQELKGFMQRGNVLPEDVRDGEASISYLQASGGVLRQAISASEADFIQVDLMREPIEGIYTTVTADPSQGIIRGIVSGYRQLAPIVNVIYNYFLVDYQSYAAYPLKPVSQAWMELNNGGGYVARLDAGVDEVTVRRVELAYFESFEPQVYFQPVYVFGGDDNFIGYVAATTNVLPER